MKLIFQMRFCRSLYLERLQNCLQSNLAIKKLRHSGLKTIFLRFYLVSCCSWGNLGANSSHRKLWELIILQPFGLHWLSVPLFNPIPVRAGPLWPRPPWTATLFPQCKSYDHQNSWLCFCLCLNGSMKVIFGVCF